MKLFRLLVAIQLMLLMSALAFSQESPRSALLKGVVTDPNNAVIPRAVITVTGKDKSYQAITVDTNERGEYALQLPPGVYDIKVDSDLGFITTQHSPIRVEADSINILNFKMYVKYLVLSGAPGATKDHPSDHPQIDYFPYEYLPVPVSGADGLDCGMIRFARKEESRSNITYKDYGLSPWDGRDGVTFTYDLFSVEADEIRFNNETKEILAIGKITIELSGEKQELTGTVKVTINRGIVSYSRVVR